MHLTICYVNIRFYVLVMRMRNPTLVRTAHDGLNSEFLEFLFPHVGTRARCNTRMRIIEGVD